MNIRPVEESDVGSVAELQLSTALTAYADIFPAEAPKPDVADMESRWRAILAEGIGWVAEEDGDPVGMAALMPEGAGSSLEAVYVAPDRWSQGVGSRLVDRAEKEAVRRGWLPLRLWVLEANVRTRRWYERRGWELDPDRRRTIWGPIEDVGYVFGAAARWNEAPLEETVAEGKR